MVQLGIATLEDLQGILELNIDEYWDSRDSWQKADLNHRWEQARWWGDADLLRWHRDILERASGGIIVARNNGIIIGELDYVVSFGSQPDQPSPRNHIIWVLVDRRYRRQQIASNLLFYLRDHSQLPTWVEPEDRRSTRLYEKLGQVTTHLTNWYLERRSLRSYQSGRDADLDMLFDRVCNDEWILVGNYYAPQFDYYQLKYSDPVHPLIWGNTPAGLCKSYVFSGCQVIALLTQFPRIALQYLPDKENMRKILSTICSDLFSMGFEAIYFQYHSHPNINKALEELDARCQIERDPIYSLFNR